MLSSRKRKLFSSEISTDRISELEKFLETIAHKCISTQKKIAIAIQKGSEHLSVTGKKLALIIFCFIGVATSIYVFTENIFYKKNSDHFLVSSTPISKHVFENDDENYVILPQDEFNKIEDFKKYIDSLSMSISGKKIKDSILKFRPLLMDSINQLEKIYQLQEKK